MVAARCRGAGRFVGVSRSDVASVATLNAISVHMHRQPTTSANHTLLVKLCPTLRLLAFTQGVHLVLVCFVIEVPRSIPL